MKLWVPGSGGLVGSTFVHYGSAFCLPTGKEIDIGDLSQVRLFLEKHPSVTHIVNCSALSGVDFCEMHPEEAFRVNALGPENLAIAAAEKGIRLIHLSTDYVFSGEGVHPLKESDPVGPVNIYGKSKLEGEIRVQKAFPKACILRTSWVFGSGGKNFVARLLSMFQEKEEIELSDDQWGRPTYALDLVLAIHQMLDHSGLYQFANRGAATKFAFAVLMRELALSLDFPIRTKRLIPRPSSAFPSPCKRPIYSVFDTSKIEPFLKGPIRLWQEALREFLCSIKS